MRPIHNESYICFRRREIKTVRASQVTSLDKLLHLQSEFLSSLELAKNVLNHETVKREAAHQTRNVWEKRLSLIELKGKFPSLGVKEDKDRVPKRPKMDSTSVYVLFTDFFVQVQVTDIINRAASCPVSDSRATAAS
jgi:enhancer of polycomb-like protein